MLKYKPEYKPDIVKYLNVLISKKSYSYRHCKLYSFSENL